MKSIDESAQQPTNVRYKVLAVTCSLAILTYVQRQGFIAATPYIKKDLGLHDSQMGDLLAVWLLAYGAFQVPFGLLGDRIGSRRLLTLLVVGWSTTLLLVASTVFLPPGGQAAYLALLILRFIFGGFQAGVFPGIARIVADWIPVQQRGAAQGSIWTFSRLGGALAPVFVVWLITKVLLDASGRPGWPLTITLIAVMGMVWTVLFWLWFRNRPEDMPGVNLAERELILQHRPVTPASTGPFPLVAFLTSPSVWGLCLMYGFVGFAGNFVTSFLNLYLDDHRHLPDETTAWLSGFPLACGVVSCLSGGAVSDWLIRKIGSRIWGRRLVGCTSLALAGVAAFCTPWVDSVWQLALVFGAWFFFNDGMMGPAWASCADIGDRYAGTLSGAMNMTGALFGAIGMKLAGFWLGKHHYVLLFSVFALSYVCAALCWFAVDVTKPLVRVKSEPT